MGAYSAIMFAFCNSVNAVVTVREFLVGVGGPTHDLPDYRVGEEGWSQSP